jgi:cytochrome P450
VAVIMTACITGTSTRKVDGLVKALGCDKRGVKSTVSRICHTSDFVFGGVYVRGRRPWGGAACLKGAMSMDMHGPVIDWAADFDLFDAAYLADPAAIWHDLRGRCPVARTERRGTTWLPVDYADLRAVAQDTDHFSSRDVGVVTAGRGPGETRPKLLTAPPITSDPPMHTWTRRLLLTRFGPQAIETMTPITQAIADDLIDAFEHDGRTDAALSYARHIPVRVIATMLGLPLDDEARFTDWAVRILQQGFDHLTEAAEATREVLAYFGEQLAARAAVPDEERPDDILSFLVAAEHDGAPLSSHHQLGSCFLLLLAGIDTTWSAIASALWHLATHPGDQVRLRREPALIPTAVEEVLRFYSPVTMARHVTDDTELAGCPMHAADKVLLAFPAGNRDPAVFDDPDAFHIDRLQNRHVAFGSGIHRCLGSNLARMELRIAMQTFLARIPTFAIDPDTDPAWSGGQVRGPRHVALHWK